MSEEKPKPERDEDAELEREIRAQRKYSLSEAIGRAAGDLMKGASPVTHKRQAELAIEQYLANHLGDAAGALAIELQRQVRESEDLLAQSYDRPLEALAGVTARILGSPARLSRFVQRVDAEWGRMYSERPLFELGGAPPRPDDPYTLESVRGALTALLEDLRGAVTS